MVKPVVAPAASVSPPSAPIVEPAPAPADVKDDDPEFKNAAEAVAESGMEITWVHLPNCEHRRSMPQEKWQHGQYDQVR